jgi:hypothetical protein
MTFYTLFGMVILAGEQQAAIDDNRDDSPNKLQRTTANERGRLGG